MIYLLDSSIYIFGGWQRLPASTISAHGEPFNAVTGFTNTLVSVLETQTPRLFCAAFDSRNRNAIRYRIHPQYKAGRAPSPPELQRQFQHCQSVCDALGVAHFSHPEIEADDIIGHFARQAHAAHQRITIISADKDLVQFVGNDDILWNYAKNQRSNCAQLTKRFGVRPEQIADLLALSGDKTDNIPGVPGVGVATAARVLHKWGDLDGVFANLEAVAAMRFRGAKHVATLLAEHEPTIRMARQLTGCIAVDDLPDTLDSLTVRAPLTDATVAALMRIGFNDIEAIDLSQRVQNAYAHTAC